MKSNLIRQGEVLLFPGASIPKGERKAVPGNIAGHSETGHHHVVVGEPGTFELVTVGEEMFLRVTEEGVSLVHEKPADKHQAIVLTPNTYRIGCKREYAGNNVERRVRD